MADPFTDHALRPTTSNATSLPSAHLRSQTSQTSLRSGAGSAASNRARQPRELFAPTISRRTAQRRVDDDVHVDSDTDQEAKRAPAASRLRRVRKMSPDARQTRHKQKHEEEADMVYRQPDGGFLREVPGEAEALHEHLTSPELKEEQQYEAIDDEYASIARHYFASGASVGIARGRRMDQEFDDVQSTALTHLRTQVLQKLEDERWRFEPTLS